LLEFLFTNTAVMVIHNQILVAVLYLLRRNIFFWATFLSCRLTKIHQQQKKWGRNNIHLHMKTPVWWLLPAVLECRDDRLTSDAHQHSLIIYSVVLCRKGETRHNEEQDYWNKETKLRSSYICIYFSNL